MSVVTAASYERSVRRPPQHPALLVEDTLTIGGATFRYRDVTSFEWTTTAERDWNGQLVCAATYGMGSAIFLLGIMIGSLDWKFLIAVVFLAAICFMSICDARGTPMVVVQRIDMVLADGRRFAFVDGDERVASIIARRLASAGAAQV